MQNGISSQKKDRKFRFYCRRQQHLNVSVAKNRMLRIGPPQLHRMKQLLFSNGIISPGYEREILFFIKSVYLHDTKTGCRLTKKSAAGRSYDFTPGCLRFASLPFSSFPNAFPKPYGIFQNRQPTTSHL